MSRNQVFENVPPYYFEQCKILRDEIARRQLARNRLEEFTILGVVAIYAWLSSTDVQASQANVKVVGWLLPPAIIAISYVRQITITKGIDRAADYIARAEKFLADDRLLGWEDFVLSCRGGEPFGGIRRINKYLWLLIFVVTACASARATLIITGFM